MKFCISGQWPVADILPTSNEAASALAALRLYREFVRLGLSPVKAFQITEDGTWSEVSAWKLRCLAMAESRRARKTVASALLGMVASALPNSFGDFGTVAGLGTFRAARTSQSSGLRPRRSRNWIETRVAEIIDQ